MNISKIMAIQVLKQSKLYCVDEAMTGHLDRLGLGIPLFANLSVSKTLSRFLSIKAISLRENMRLRRCFRKTCHSNL